MVGMVFQLMFCFFYKLDLVALRVNEEEKVKENSNENSIFS